uniref:Predicted protein n=1 Tax=Hordeum vulgare subsp. vulgare TaxID=112509 RepID=F2E9J1_HORVV|nr:predicted protein [Hordeum vulgare subsp. vulgare]
MFEGDVIQAAVTTSRLNKFPRARGQRGGDPRISWRSWAMVSGCQLALAGWVSDGNGLCGDEDSSSSLSV